MLLRQVEEELGRRWDELDRVRADLRASDPRYAALTQPRLWSAAEIQAQLLDRDTLLLEYRLGETRSFLWAVTPDSLKSFELPGRAEIERVARPACDLLARSRSHTAEISAGLQLAKLSRLLLDPVAPLLPGKRLLIVGDGILQNLPFAALPEPGRRRAAGRPPRDRRSAVGVGPRRATPGGRRPAGGAEDAVGAGRPCLRRPVSAAPVHRQEAAAILTLAPASESFAVQGREASRAAVLHGDLRDYRFLHFATHGSFAATDPGGGRLVLAQIDRGAARTASSTSPTSTSWTCGPTS